MTSRPTILLLKNVVRQSIQLVGQLPVIMAYAYQVKRRHYLKKSMYIHPAKPDQSTAETILRSIRSDKTFTDDEAKLLDLCLMVHAEHGGGNNSTFATRVLTSSGTDTYAAIAAGMGSLKGPKHGGANIKAAEMIRFIQNGVSDPTDDGQIATILQKLSERKPATIRVLFTEWVMPFTPFPIPVPLFSRKRLANTPKKPATRKNSISLMPLSA